jgi:hypothetical protein
MFRIEMTRPGADFVSRIRLQAINRILAVALAPALAAITACSSFSVPTPEDILPNTPKFEFKSLAPARPIRPFGAPSLINPDGSCAPVGDPEFASGGIALDMSECDVVQRAGAPDNIEVTPGPRGERAVVLTYARGDRPGIYRFVAGRLVSMERGPEPPAPEKPAKPAKKKAPKKSADAPARSPSFG